MPAPPPLARSRAGVSRALRGVSSSLRIVAALGVLGTACTSGDTPPDPDAVASDAPTSDGAPGDAPASDGAPGDAPATLDTSLAGLEAFVQSGGYAEWAAEPAIHPSAGPHGGNVRVFINETLRASLAAGNATHPPGSAVVKELYGSGTTTITGHAIDVKDAATGEWVFFEGFVPEYNQYYFRGTDNFCAGCHAGGSDYVLTSPL